MRKKSTIMKIAPRSSPVMQTIIIYRALRGGGGVITRGGKINAGEALTAVEFLTRC